MHRNQLDLFTTPDEIKIDVEDFNRKVITESFNRVVCEFLAQELDPSSRQKTLIFCANDAHADLAMHLLKQSFTRYYGSIDDDAVIKITGAADKPLQLLRRYKNERHPNVVVTVDLLTTGVDVPEICNLVFLCRVNSRILFDQMLGRATRLCDAISKETFRIFDAVKIYEALLGMTAMQPVVVNPAITFTHLAHELAQVASNDERALVRDQFIAKLQRKKRHLSEATAHDFETRVGMSPDAFIEQLKTMPLANIAARIVGYIRQAAIGDPLVPYDQRVDSALQKLLASRAWSTPQRQWLQRIAAQTKANMLVDREALDDPDLVFKHEGGGFARLDRIFGGELQQVLDTFNESLWPPAA